MAVQRFLLTHRRLLTILALLLALAAVRGAAAGTAGGGDSLEIGELGSFRISGPCIHENLALYPVHGEKGAAPEIEFMTLAEALEDGVVVVNETGDVNRLTIRNRSDRYVFIQAGDIVRGGQQDRLLAHDLVLPPRSGKVPIGSFCVESGRWTGRGKEDSKLFASSSNQAVSNEMKIAYRKQRSQQEVWRNVSEVQTGLAESLRVPVRDGASPSSMELTLNNEAVQKAILEYHRALGGCVSGSDDVVGVIAVVNGRFRSANIYAWHHLFARMWPKTLSALAAEAIASRSAGTQGAPPGSGEVRKLVAAPEGTESEVRKIGAGLEEHVAEYPGAVRFISRDGDLGWIRAEVLANGK